MKPVKFKSVLICDPPEKGWHYISVEAKHAEKFEKKEGTRRVICTLNGSETFPCALMPYQGTYFVMGSSSETLPCSTSCMTAVAVRGLEMDAMR